MNIKAFTSIKIIAKAITTSTCAVCLVACGGAGTDRNFDADTEVTTGTDNLASEKSALNTETPVGIWLINSDQAGNYSSVVIDTNIDTVRSVQQFVIIKEVAKGTYSMPQCGLDIFSENENIILNIDDEKVLRSGSADLSDRGTETYALDLIFKDNLSFSGTIDVTRKNTADDSFYVDTTQVEISAVKVSDSTVFETSEELSVVFSAQRNHDPVLILSYVVPSVTCLAIASTTYNGTLQTLETSINEETIHMVDADDNTAKFDLESGRLGAESIADKSYFSSLTYLQSHGSVSCAADAGDCTAAKSLTLNQAPIMKSSASSGISLIGIKASASAINDNDESLKVSFSVAIK